MSVVKINAIDVPEGAGPELEARFAARAHSVDGSPGFEGFQLLRPTAGENRYFVVTTWATEEDFRAWADGPAKEAHRGPDGGGARKPVATGASLLEFEVVDLQAVAEDASSE
ncbi:antibiotic biosynthesis monooxygenase [Corynebacteriaceae bacterium 7-707]